MTALRAKRGLLALFRQTGNKKTSTREEQPIREQGEIDGNRNRSDRKGATEETAVREGQVILERGPHRTVGKSQKDNKRVGMGQLRGP